MGRWTESAGLQMPQQEETRAQAVRIVVIVSESAELTYHAFKDSPFFTFKF